MERKFEITKNQLLTANVFKMTLQGDVSAIKCAGQFVNIELPEKFLRRPISVCDVDFERKTLTIIYKIVGAGTEQMSKMQRGDKLDLLTGLGNGFNIDVDIQKPILVGGGVGCPPLFYLAKCLINKNLHPKIILAFNTKSEIFLQKEFQQLGLQVFVSTLDGSLGTKGFATDTILQNNLDFDYYFTCGPMPMLKAIHNLLKTNGQLSFEERMGCGFGGCMGCTCKTKSGYKQICKDTILNSNDVLF